MPWSRFCGVERLREQPFHGGAKGGFVITGGPKQRLTEAENRGGCFFRCNGRLLDFRDVDPCELHVPPSRRQGADPAKLARQIALFGRSAVGMPAPWVYEGTDGALVLYHGVSRATRIAKLAPGTFIRVEVIGKLRRAYASDPKIGDLLP